MLKIELIAPLTTLNGVEGAMQGSGPVIMLLVVGRSIAISLVLLRMRVASATEA